MSSLFMNDMSVRGKKVGSPYTPFSMCNARELTISKDNNSDTARVLARRDGFFPPKNEQKRRDIYRELRRII